MSIMDLAWFVIFLLCPILFLVFLIFSIRLWKTDKKRSRVFLIISIVFATLSSWELNWYWNTIGYYNYYHLLPPAHVLNTK
jgi:hypothetical protein